MSFQGYNCYQLYQDDDETSEDPTNLIVELAGYV
jgi:hypothetical protein